MPRHVPIIPTASSITGTAGIASEEAFGADGVIAGAIVGTTGIASAESFGADGVMVLVLPGTAGIVSGEAFGADGSIALTQTITGTTGIATGETFGAGGVLNFTIVGTAGITSGETFGTPGIVAGPLVGVTGIASGETFGSGGSVSSNTLTGVTGIPSGEAFGADGTLGSIGGPLTGVIGIPSAEAFGATGIITGPILGTAGIPSGEAFGAGGSLLTLISGQAVGGIVSGEAFGVGGSLIRAVSGVIGIPSAEAFGTTGTMLLAATTFSNFRTFLGSVDVSSHVRAGTIAIQRQLNFSASGSFDYYDELTDAVPSIGTPIVQYHYNGSVWKKYFGGTIESTSGTKPRNIVSETGYNLITVNVVDWGKSLARRLINKKYPAATFGSLQKILADLSAILSAEGITIVQQTLSDVSLPDMEFKFTPLNDVLNQLCDATNLSWQVDWDKNCYIFNRPSFIQFAPFDVNDHDGNIRNIVVNRNRGLYRNRQYANVTTAPKQNTSTITKTYQCFTVKSPALGDPYHVIAGNSQLLDTEYNGRVLDVVQMTIDRHDMLGPISIPFILSGHFGDHDYYWGQISPNDLNFAWDLFLHADIEPASGDTLTITFVVDSGSTPAGLVFLDNASEIAARQAIEGGTGLYEDVLVITAPLDSATLNGLLQAMLDRFSVMGLEVDYQTEELDLEIGQQQIIDLPKMSVNTITGLIEKISSREISKTILQHDVMVSNATQQRDALAAFTRLIRKINKGERQVQRVYNWELATSQPGSTNPGLSVANAVGVPLVVTDPNGIALDSFTVRFKTGATGANIHLRVRANGVSIFNGVGYISYPAGATSTEVYYSFANAPLLLLKGTVLEMDVLQIGSGAPGQDGIAHLVGYV